MLDHEILKEEYLVNTKSIKDNENYFNPEIKICGIFDGSTAIL